MGVPVSRYVIFLTLVAASSLWGSEQTDFAQSSLWSLKPGWWTSLTTGSDTEVDGRMKEVMVPLDELSLRVPEENREIVRASVDRIRLNSNEYLALRSSKGWQIEAAPTVADQYSIDELLAIAREVKVDDARVQEAQGNIQRTKSTLERMRKQVDELYDSYNKTADNSLQRTLDGLKIMVAVSNHALVSERLRIAQEELAGIQQKLSWSQDLLTKASQRLVSEQLDEGALDEGIAQVRQRRLHLDSELLQVETELASRQPNTLDTRPLDAVSMRVMLSRAICEEIALEARRHICHLFDKKLNKEEAQLLIDQSKVWNKDLGKIDRQIGEWRGLIRKAQDAAESAFLQESEANQEPPPSKCRAHYNHQRSVQDALVNVRDLDLELFQTRQLGQVVANAAILELGWFTGFWERMWLNIQHYYTKVTDGLSVPLFRINERTVTLYKLFQALAVFLLAYGLSFMMRRFLTELANRKAHISVASVYTFKRVAHYAILLIGLIWALDTLGLDFSNLLIIAGALSVGIGFGLQGIVNNFLGGLIVLFDRKLRIGDFIELSDGQMGTITEVNVQNTVIRTLTGHDILVPNSDIITRQLSNWTLRDQYARFHLPFGVAYGSEKEKVKAVVSQAARKVEETVYGHNNIPDPNVWLVGFGDSSLNFELVVWVDFRKTKKRQSSLSASYYWEIETALKENGIEIPFPQRDLHLKSGNWTPAKAGAEE